MQAGSHHPHAHPRPPGPRHAAGRSIAAIVDEIAAALDAVPTAWDAVARSTPGTAAQVTASLGVLATGKFGRRYRDRALAGGLASSPVLHRGAALYPAKTAAKHRPGDPLWQIRGQVIPVGARSKPLLRALGVTEDDGRLDS